MLRKIVFCVVSLLILSCKGDNDDIILANDTANINFETGILFGSIDPLGDSFVYNFTNEGIFLVTNAGGVTDSADWTFSDCPFAEDSFTYEVARDIENIARGVRVIPSTDIGETRTFGERFFVLEYETNEGEERKTIQFLEEDELPDEQINAYFDYIEETIGLLALDAGNEFPLTLVGDLCE